MDRIMTWMTVVAGMAATGLLFFAIVGIVCHLLGMSWAQ